MSIGATLLDGASPDYSSQIIRDCAAGLQEYAPLSVKKRKTSATICTQWQLLTIRAISDTTSDLPPIQVHPLFFLPRTSLPLNFLALEDEHHHCASAKLFVANQNGTLCLKFADSVESTVLVAQQLSDDTLFAIEQVGADIFTLSRIAERVTPYMLEELQSSEPSAKRRSISHSEEGARCEDVPWWQSASLPEDQTPSMSSNIESMRSANEHSHKTYHINNGKAGSPSLKGEVNIENATQLSTDSPEHSLEAIRIQYQEALYTSKAPLAYFAKGPLSRARAFFQGTDVSNNGPGLLIHHLEGLIMTLATLDRKYKDTLPGIFRELPFHLSDREDGAALLLSMRPRKSIKKSGVKKNGLYANEDVEVKSWWLSKDVSNTLCDTPEAREDFTKNLLLDQKSRETQLQIILILETLALRTSKAESHTLTDPTETHGLTNINESSVPDRSRKGKNLETLLDLQIDRLSIWQSMVLEESKPSEDKQRLKEEEVERGVKHDQKANHLRSFCVDVVLPFFGSRLPQTTATLCRKLSDSKDPSPRRPLLAKSASTQSKLSGKNVSKRRPGAKAAQRTLERVLTDDHLGHRRRVSSLSRSATESALPQMKREVSEISLSLMSTKGGTASQRYSHREVDLQACSQTVDAKVKTKAQVEHELRGAIATLKKPNARMAVKDFVDAADQRNERSRPRKPKHPLRHPFATQVAATPSKDRSLDVHLLQQRRQDMRSNSKSMSDFAVGMPSKIFCSSTKPSWTQEPSLRASDSVPYNDSHVEQTPTKASARVSESEQRLGKRMKMSTSFGALRYLESTGGVRECPDISHQMPVNPAILHEIHGNERARQEICQSLDVGVQRVHMTPVKSASVSEPVSVDDGSISDMDGIAVQESQF